MKRTPQEIIELVVFGLIGLLVGTGVLWLVGSLLRLVAMLFVWLAGALWALISFLVPVALIAGAIVLGVRWAQGRPWHPFGSNEPSAAPSYSPPPPYVPTNGGTVPRPPAAEIPTTEISRQQAADGTDESPSEQDPSESAGNGDEAQEPPRD
jgi:hypothetical protein